MQFPSKDKNEGATWVRSKVDGIEFSDYSLSGIVAVSNCDKNEIHALKFKRGKDEEVWGLHAFSAELQGSGPWERPNLRKAGEELRIFHIEEIDCGGMFKR